MKEKFVIFRSRSCLKNSFSFLACIDYSYFALAQTFDIQTKREERYRIQAQSPLYESRSYGSTTTNDYHENDLDQLFPDRVRHKNFSSENNSLNQSNGANQTQLNHNHEVIIRDSYNSNNENSEEPSLVHPIRQPISQKTKNW